jgi:hypothetical protein
MWVLLSLLLLVRMNGSSPDNFGSSWRFLSGCPVETAQVESIFGSTRVRDMLSRLGQDTFVDGELDVAADKRPVTAQQRSNSLQRKSYGLVGSGLL